MKTEMLFCLFFLFLLQSLNAQKTNVDLTTESTARHDTLPEIEKGELAVDSSMLSKENAISFQMTIQELCNCNIKIKLLNKKFWLPDTTSLEELVYLLGSGARILKTKHIDVSVSVSSFVQKQVAKELYEKIPQMKDWNTCSDWKCKIMKFVGQLFGWVFELGKEFGRD